MSANIFDYTDYRKYITKALEGRGQKLELSNYLSCQSAYISRVLADQADLSLEQALKTAAYFEFRRDETDYFIMLVNIQKAGSHELKQYFKQKSAEIREKATSVTAQINPDLELSGEEKAIFYSSWEYGAILILTTIPGFDSKIKIQKRLEISAEDCSRKVDFMLKAGILKQDSKGVIKPGSKRAHLDKESDLERGMQISWRLKAIESFPKQTPHEIRFSALYTLSEQDIETIRMILIEAIARAEKVTAHTQEETLHALCIDWFRV